MDNDNCCSGHGQPDEKTEKKLLELEDSLQVKPVTALPATVSSQDLLKVKKVDLQTPSLKEDLYYFSGIALLAFGILALFQHIRVGTGFLQALGLTGQGFGLALLPLLLGIGIVIYNPKDRLGYLIISLTCALLFYAVLASLIMTFPPMSLLALIVMLVPLAAGGAFVIKGLGGRTGIESRMRQQGLLKSPANKAE